MWRGLIWIVKLVAAGLILSFLSIWTTGYIVTSYVESVLKQFQLPIEVPPMAMSGVWGKLWGSDPLLATELESTGMGQEGGDEAEPEAAEVFGEIEEPPLVDIGVGEGAHAGVEGETQAGTEVQEGAAGVTDTEDLDGTETALTTDDIKSTKEEMSEEDKATLFQLLMTKLPQESWQQISEFVENGLTEQELSSIQQMMAQHLDQSEYDRMMEILKKY